MGASSVSLKTLRRLPGYLGYLKTLPSLRVAHISATAVAEALGLNDVQVRKDLAAVSRVGGKPKVGYAVDSLIADIEHFLGYDNTENAVIVGAGNLGRALLSYEGFSRYGMDIVAAFDKSPAAVGQSFGGKRVFPLEKLPDLCARLKIRIGILTVPSGAAQEAADLLVQSGVIAIWNFAPVRLSVPEGIHVQNENLVSSLSVLSKHLSEMLLAEEEGAAAQ